MSETVPPVMQDPETPKGRLMRLHEQRAAYLHQMGIAQPRETAFGEIGDMLKAPESRGDFVDYLKTGARTPKVGKFIGADDPNSPEHYRSKEDHGFLRDFVTEPAIKFLVAPAQGLTDLGSGIGLWKKQDLASKIKSNIRSIYDPTPRAQLYEQQKAEQQAYDETKGTGAKVVQGGAQVAGEVLGFKFNPVLRAGSAGGSAVLRFLTGASAEAVKHGSLLLRGADLAARGAGGFGALGLANPNHGEAATTEQRLHEGAIGAAMGPLFEIAGAAGKAAFYKVLRGGVPGGLGKEVAYPYAKWAAENGMSRLQSESANDFFRRSVNAWIDAGTPGFKPGIGTARKMAAYGAQAMVEGLGFSALDENFRKDLVAAAIARDEKAFGKLAADFLPNALGMLFVHAGGRLADIPRLQRSMPDPTPIDFNAKDPNAKPPEPPKGAAPQGQEPAPPAPQGPSAAQQKSLDRMGRTNVMWRHGWVESPAGAKPVNVPEPFNPNPDALPGEVVKAPENGAPSLPEFQQAQQRTAEGVPRRVEIPESPYWYDEFQGQVRPSPKLRSALGIPESMPVDEFMPVLEKAALMSALHAKTALPGTEVSAEGVIGETDTFRTIRFGELLERAATVNSKWKPVDQAPARGKDAISEPQKVWVKSLLDIAQQRGDMDRADQEVLNASIAALDTIAAERDPSVKETLDALPALAPIIAQGDPQHAGMAVKALAESLTVKHPQIAIADMAKGLEEQAPKPAEAKPSEPAAEQGGTYEVMSGVKLPPEAAELGKAAGSIVGRMARKAWRGAQEGLIDRLKRLTSKEEAERAYAARDESQRIEREAGPQGLSRLRRNTKTRVKELEDVVTDDKGNQTTIYYGGLDEHTGRYFGINREGLTGRAKEVMDDAHNLHVFTAGEAEKLGLSFKNAKEGGPQGITANPDRWRGVRVATPQLREALQERHGDFYEAFVRMLSDTNGMTPDAVKKEWSEVRGITADSATEVMRKFKVAATQRVENGRTYHFFEDSPREHIERMIAQEADVLGAKAKFYDPDAKVGAEPMDKGEGYGSDPSQPLPAMSWVKKIAEKYGRAAADAAADVARVLHHIPIDQRSSWMREVAPPGSPQHAVASILGSFWNRLLKSANLTTAFVQNRYELLTDAPLLGGYGAIKRATAKLWRHGADMTLDKAVQELSAEGWIPDTEVPTYRMHGANTEETFKNVLTVVSDVLTKPMQIGQVDNYLTVAFAAKERLAAMREGQGTQGDIVALMRVGFDRADAKRIAEGGGTEAEYARYRLNVVGTMTTSKAQRAVDKPLLQHNRMMRTLFAFTDFFSGRMALLDTMAKNVREAEGASEKWKASATMAHFLVANGVGGALGAMTLALLKGGVDGMLDWLREANQNKVEAIAQVMTGGLVGGLGRGVQEMLTRAPEPGSAEDWLPAISRTVYPVAQSVRLLDFMRALAGLDVPGYENKNGWQKVSHYVAGQMPLAKAAHDGLFGISVLALGEEDPALTRAINSAIRWRMDNKPFAHGDRAPEGRDFRDSIRGIVDDIRAGKLYGDEAIMEQVQKAIQSKFDQASEAGQPMTVSKAKQAIADAIDGKRFIPSPTTIGWTQAQREAFYAHLGDANWQLLQQHDAVLHYMAKRIRGH